MPSVLSFLSAGLYVLARATPVLPFFDAVYADIGDQQSLAQSLSTFSGHVQRIGRIMDACAESSLVLLDEVGLLDCAGLPGPCPSSSVLSFQLLEGPGSRPLLPSLLFAS